MHACVWVCAPGDLCGDAAHQHAGVRHERRQGAVQLQDPQHRLRKRGHRKLDVTGVQKVDVDVKLCFAVDTRFHMGHDGG